MFLKLFLLLTLVPLVELSLFLWLHSLTSFYFTLGYVIVTGLIGALLARFQGAWTWNQIHQQLSQGQIPSDALFDAFLIVIAGALLITPGILTDCVGFSLLIPPCRKVIKGWLMRYFESRFTVRTFGSEFQSSQVYESRHPDSHQHDSNIIEGEVVRSEITDAE